jgi:hypothetical protein
MLSFGMVERTTEPLALGVAEAGTLAIGASQPQLRHASGS